MSSEPFEVDLADIESVKAQIPEVERRIEGARLAARDAQRNLAHWNAILVRLRFLTGATPQKEQPKEREPTVLQEVVRIVEQRNAPTRARDVMSRLGPDAKRETVGWALWKAESEHRIKRLRQGIYAPLDYEPETLLNPHSGAKDDDESQGMNGNRPFRGSVVQEETKPTSGGAS